MECNQQKADSMKLSHPHHVRMATLACAVLVIGMATHVQIGPSENAADAAIPTDVTNSSTRPASTRPATQQSFDLLEDQLVFPGHFTQGTPEAIWRTGPTDKLITLIAKDGTRITAVFGKGVRRANDPNASHRATLIYFYGNGMCMAQSRQVINEFRKLGYNVITPDYEGYGMSGGSPSEAGCYATADAVYDYLLHSPDVDSKKLVAVGWSLGSAVAIDLASRRPVVGLITLSAFTNILDLSTHFAPGSPASLLVTSRFESLAKISAVSCPILMFHGEQDTFVPPEMTDRLAAAAKVNAKHIRIRRAGHNDIFAIGGQSLFQQVQTFLNGLK